MKLLAILIISIIASIANRMGGSGRFNRLWRILGVPFLSIVAIWLCFGVRMGFWWAYLVSFGAMAGAVSAYWGLDEKPWGYWAHGLGLSLAVLPIAIATQHYLGFSIRCLVLTGLVALWSQFISSSIEENGRGFLIVASLLLLTI